MHPAASSTSARRTPLVAALVVTVLCAAWMALVLTSSRGAPSVPDDQTIVFGDRPSPAEMWISKVDGVHFAQLAQDPLYRNTVHNFRGDAPRASYRALRPIQGWVEWAASIGGRPNLLAPAIIALTVLTIGLLPVAVSALASALDRHTLNPVLVLGTPGVIANLWAPGMSEPLAALLALVGSAAWLRDHRRLGVVLFCVAALTKETSLAVPAGLALAEMVMTRRLRRSLPLLLAPASYVAWSTFVSIRVGPVVTDEAAVTGWQPLVGLIDAVPHWSAADAVAVLAIAVSAVVIVRLREPVLTGMVMTHMAMFFCMGSVVWMNWWGFGRAALPLTLIALVGGHRRTEGASVESLDEASNEDPGEISEPAPAAV
ncbi:MAG: hypothetical protein KDB02_14665 [Acidimicrobiales bacterium]|nr:hypothetical protein [Acidimicrobiales bacterium]